MKDLTKEMHFAESDQLTTITEIERLANRLLDTTWTINIYRNKPSQEINLSLLGWKFEFNNRKRAAGLCSYREKTIAVSMYLLKQNLDQGLSWENTLRHELAHAVDGAIGGRNHHNRIWKAIAREVLCNAERCYSSDVIKTTETTKYTMVCSDDDCDYQRASHKKRKVNARSTPCCNKCYKDGKGYVHLKQIQNY